MNYSTVIIDYLIPQFPLPAPNSRLRPYYHSITDDLHRIYKKINLGFFFVCSWKRRPGRRRQQIKKKTNGSKNT